MIVGIEILLCNQFWVIKIYMYIFQIFIQILQCKQREPVNFFSIINRCHHLIVYRFIWHQENKSLGYFHVIIGLEKHECTFTKDIEFLRPLQYTDVSLNGHGHENRQKLFFCFLCLQYFWKAFLISSSQQHLSVNRRVKCEIQSSQILFCHVNKATCIYVIFLFTFWMLRWKFQFKTENECYKS